MPARIQALSVVATSLLFLSSGVTAITATKDRAHLRCQVHTAQIRLMDSIANEGQARVLETGQEYVDALTEYRAALFSEAFEGVKRTVRAHGCGATWFRERAT